MLSETNLWRSLPRCTLHVNKLNAKLKTIDTVYFIGFQDPDELKFRHHVLDQLGEMEIKDGKIVPKQ